MKKFSLGLEAIEFQDSQTFNTIKHFFDKLINENYKNDKTLKELELYVKKRFGLSTHTVLDLYETGYSTTSILNQNHIFIGNYVKEEYRKLLNTKTITGSTQLENIQKLKSFNEQNTIDLKKAIVTGLFSELKGNINIVTQDSQLLGSEGMAAIYLHELGHLFTYFEFLTKSITANYCMMAICSAAEQQVKQENKVILIKKINETIYLKDDALDVLLDVKDTTTTATIFMDIVSKPNKSITGTYFYDWTTAEQVADQFVSRLGGGRELIIALDKLYKKHGVRTRHSEMFWFDVKVNIFRFVTGLLISTLIPFGVIVAIYVIYVQLTLSGITGFFSHNFTYDEPKVRLKRIRNDYMVALKNNKDIEVKKYLIKEIDQCDVLIADYTEYKPVLDIVSNYLLSKNRSYNELYQLQRDLEDIAFNDLFIKAEKLLLA